MRRFLILGAAVALLLVFAPAARACSCADGDPRTSLTHADAAFVGTAVRVPERSLGGQEVSWEFTVERAVKGDLRDRVTVWSAADGGMCGLSVEAGRRIGLFLQREGERWSSSLCSQIDPDRLLAATSPLPAPDGSGPPAFIVGGDVGDVGVVALDDKGRTLAYGNADGGASSVSVCPGGTRVVALRFLEQGRARAILYELPGLNVLRAREVVTDAYYPMAIGCGDPAGDDLYVFYEKPAMPQSQLTLYRLHRDDPQSVVWTGPGMMPAFDPGGRFAVVPVKEPPSLTVVDLPSGRARLLATLPQAATRLAVHPAGRSVLVMAANFEQPAVPAPPALLRVVGMDGRTIAERTLDGVEGGGGFLWSGDNEVVVTTLRTTVAAFDGRLRPKGTWSGELGWATTAREGRLYAVDHRGSMQSAHPRSGGLTEMRALPEGRYSALVALPRVEAPVGATTTTVPPTTVPPSTVSTPPVTELAADPAASTGDGDVPGVVGTAAVLALVATAYATRVIARRRLTPASLTVLGTFSRR